MARHKAICNETASCLAVTVREERSDKKQRLLKITFSSLLLRFETGISLQDFQLRYTLPKMENCILFSTVHFYKTEKPALGALQVFLYVVVTEKYLWGPDILKK